jgi:putative hemolysin
MARWARRLPPDRDLSEAELRDLVAHSRVLDREERRLIDDVLAAGDRRVSELMVPRTEAVFLEAHMTIEEAVQIARATPHSRFPVAHDSHDDVAGFVHLRDLLLRPKDDLAFTVAEIARPVHRIPAGKPALAALSKISSRSWSARSTTSTTPPRRRSRPTGQYRPKWTVW